MIELIYNYFSIPIFKKKVKESNESKTVVMVIN